MERTEQGSGSAGETRRGAPKSAIVKPSDRLADIALFLVSPAAGFITGTTVVADGGQSLLGGSRMLDVLSG